MTYAGEEKQCFQNSNSSGNISELIAQDNDHILISLKKNLYILGLQENVCVVIYYCKNATFFESGMFTNNKSSL